MLTRLKARLHKSAREELKTARNGLVLSLQLAGTALDAFPVYGPKAAIGAILKIVEVAQVGSIILLE
jgi:hypothetical protein